MGVALAFSTTSSSVSNLYTLSRVPKTSSLVVNMSFAMLLMMVGSKPACRAKLARASTLKDISGGGLTTMATGELQGARATADAAGLLGDEGAAVEKDAKICLVPGSMPFSSFSRCISCIHLPSTSKVSGGWDVTESPWSKDPLWRRDGSSSWKKLDESIPKC